MWMVDGDVNDQFIHVLPNRYIPGIDKLIDVDIVYNTPALYRALYPPVDDPYTPFQGLIICSDNPPEIQGLDVDSISAAPHDGIDDAIRRLMIGRGSG
jgi:hypothetical protein